MNTIDRILHIFQDISHKICGDNNCKKKKIMKGTYNLPTIYDIFSE